MKIKISIVTLFSKILIVFLFTSCGDFEGFGKFEQSYHVQIKDEKLIFKLEIWGISGNHCRVILTQKDELTPSFNEEEDYIFNGMLPMAFEVGLADTLHIYTFYAPQKPPRFKAETNIKIHELEGYALKSLIKNQKSLTIIDYPSSE